MTWQGVEMEIQVPCAEGKQHPVRLRFTGWGEYEVVHNPCEELLGAVFARMAPCTHYLREQFPEVFRQDARFREQLVEALGAVGTPAVPLLIQALGDEDEDVREAACRALGEIGDRQAVPALSVWAHAGGRVAQAALQQMGEVDEVFCDGCIEVAQEYRRMRARNPAFTYYIYIEVPQEALQQMGEVDEVFCDSCIEVAQEALQQMGQAPLPLPEAVAQVVAQGAWGVLVRALPHKAVRAAVVELGTPAVPPLIQALGDEDENVRAAACEALVKIGAPAVPHLIQALGDGDWDVCWAARAAVEHIKAKQCARNKPLD
jgi:hypothetical protein